MDDVLKKLSLLKDTSRILSTFKARDRNDALKLIADEIWQIGNIYSLRIPKMSKVQGKKA